MSASAGLVPEEDTATVSTAARAVERQHRSGPAWGTWILRVLVFVVVLGLWQLADNRVLPDYLISSPTQVARTLWEYATGVQSGLWTDIRVTGEELLLGYAVGVVGGLAVGLLLGYWRLGAAVLGPLIGAVNGIPKIALAPLFLIWFGIGVQSKIAIAAMTVFFVMFYNTYMGVLTMPDNLVNVLRVMGAGRSTIIRRVTLPQISVPVLAGMKSSVSFAMIGVIVGEFIASQNGVGYLINTATQNFDSATVFAGIVVLMVMIAIGMLLVGALERWALRWQRD
ncbi:ABC transporter permease [Streptomyces sp. TS71-3]|uniref:ABC transporter permease n=1 Tax=Streptomyces sp. TS71-3 TaxID=2733862 RepID=UPI001B0BE616|nr:ABC transporter permease [Streptomyces sp. TS71-3]GHJ38703.1 ABC transporter permease [Streptomyces sp. TS71-3]